LSEASEFQEYPKMGVAKIADGRTVALKYKAPHPNTGMLVVFENADEEAAFNLLEHAEPVIGQLDTSNYHPDSAVETGEH
jgi:hypothetical protein